MEKKSSNGWKFFALLFGGLLAAVVGLYIYKQQNPDYDPWEEPWENSSSPVDLTQRRTRPKTILTSRLRTPQRTPPESTHVRQGAGYRVRVPGAFAYSQTRPSCVISDTRERSTSLFTHGNNVGPICVISGTDERCASLFTQIHNR